MGVLVFVIVVLLIFTILIISAFIPEKRRIYIINYIVLAIFLLNGIISPIILGAGIIDFFNRSQFGTILGVVVMISGSATSIALACIWEMMIKQAENVNKISQNNDEKNIDGLKALQSIEENIKKSTKSLNILTDIIRSGYLDNIDLKKVIENKSQEPPAVPSQPQIEEVKEWICIYCNTKNVDRLFCQKCGKHFSASESSSVSQTDNPQTQDFWFCSKCGNKNEGEILFCTKCGQKRLSKKNNSNPD